MSGPCPDCGVAPDSNHVPGCDAERCRLCGGQAISCECSPAKRRVPPVPWTGDWPGTAECVEFGWYARFVQGRGWVPCEASDEGAVPDLNRLYVEAVWDVCAGRFVRRGGVPVADKNQDREALTQIVDAWESLRGGRHYSPEAIGEWLAGPMAKAINKARRVLGRKKPGGGE